MTVDSFIGKNFNIFNGGMITVCEGNKLKGCKRKYICECSVCSKDKELFPYGSIVSSKGNLTNGKLPCGCAKNHCYDERQYKVLIKRECNKRGYIFHGWFGKYNKGRTKLDLENTETCNRWCSCTLSAFLYGRGDPQAAKLVRKISTTLPTEKHIQDFYKVGFTEDYKFWGSDRVDKSKRKNHWYYECPVCSNDEYVQAGLCSGVFEGHVSNLKVGKKSCRCSDKYHWTQEQREYQINKICKEEGLTFLGLVDDYKNAFSSFNWVCKEGHDNVATINNFLNHEKRCYTCYKAEQKVNGIGYGYFPNKISEKDYLYLIHFKPQNCIKVGRSFEIDRRIRELLKISDCKRSEIEVLQVLTGTHQTVYEIEQWLHEELTERGFYHEKSTWTVETFEEDCKDILYRLLKESNLQYVEV